MEDGLSELSNHKLRMKVLVSIFYTQTWPNLCVPFGVECLGYVMRCLFLVCKPDDTEGITLAVGVTGLQVSCSHH